MHINRLVERFLREKDLPPTKFGRLAARDPRLVLDMRMPEMNGLDAARAILSASHASPVRVLMLTTFDIDDYVYAVLCEKNDLISVPAGTPWSLTTITTLSRSCKRIERGESACSINCITRPLRNALRLGWSTQAPWQAAL